MVLVIVLMLMAAATLIGIAAITSSRIEMMISGNQRTLQQLLNAAEAGIDAGINAFSTVAPPWGAARPPFTDPPRTAPWGINTNGSLSNGCQFTMWISDMQVSGPPPPGNDPTLWRTYYYRIRSLGQEKEKGPDNSRAVHEIEQILGVVYQAEAAP